MGLGQADFNETISVGNVKNHDPPAFDSGYCGKILSRGILFFQFYTAQTGHPNLSLHPVASGLSFIHAKRPFDFCFVFFTRTE